MGFGKQLEHTKEVPLENNTYKKTKKITLKVEHFLKIYTENIHG
jgi:hypothetical protein